MVASYLEDIRHSPLRWVKNKDGVDTQLSVMQALTLYVMRSHTKPVPLVDIRHEVDNLAKNLHEAEGIDHRRPLTSKGMNYIIHQLTDVKGVDRRSIRLTKWTKQRMFQWKDPKDTASSD
jgi:hypothetical protein